MTATGPIWIDRNLLDAARTVGALQSRSAAEQIAHWVRIGRAVEGSRLVSHRDVTAVLSGHASFDDLNDAEQVLVRAMWEEQDAATVRALNLAAEFTAEGRGYAEADTEGNLVDYPSPGREAGAAG